VGLIGKILSSHDLTDIERRWDLAEGKPLLANPGTLYIAYLNQGGEIKVKDVPAGFHYHWTNPKTGEASSRARYDGGTLSAPSSDPWVLIISAE
jgi:hypothetical protein